MKAYTPGSFDGDVVVVASNRPDAGALDRAERAGLSTAVLASPHAPEGADLGANRLVAALPLYGYLWRPNAIASTIGFDDARRLAAEAGTTLARDPATSTLHATRAGADGWELWVSDAELVAALQREVTTLGVSRVAFWRLGLEDAALWELLRTGIRSRDRGGQRSSSGSPPAPGHERHESERR